MKNICITDSRQYPNLEISNQTVQFLLVYQICSFLITGIFLQRLCNVTNNLWVVLEITSRTNGVIFFMI